MGKFTWHEPYCDAAAQAGKRVEGTNAQYSGCHPGVSQRTYEVGGFKLCPHHYRKLQRDGKVMVRVQEQEGEHKIHRLLHAET